MAGFGVNSCALVGRLTRDPELRHTSSGDPVASFTLAVDGAGQGKDEDGHYLSGFFDVSVWGKQAEAVAQYLSKGREAAVSGRLRYRTWEAQDGTKRRGIDINADRVQFIGGRGDSDGDSGYQDGGRQQAATAATTDDDIPF